MKSFQVYHYDDYNKNIVLDSGEKLTPLATYGHLDEPMKQRNSLGANEKSAKSVDLSQTSSNSIQQVFWTRF